MTCIVLMSIMPIPQLVDIKKGCTSLVDFSSRRVTKVGIAPLLPWIETVKLERNGLYVERI